MGDLAKTVGANQKAIRAARGLTLDALAETSGVSRSNLAAIESGKANPSIGTLWQIASALKVSFSELVAVADSGTHVVDIAAVEPSTADDGRYRVQLVFAFDPTLGYELYRVEIDPGGGLVAEAHPGGTVETITVVEGELTLEVGGAKYELAAGNAIRFAADQVHAYANRGAVTVRIEMVLGYGRRG